MRKRVKRIAAAVLAGIALCTAILTEGGVSNSALAAKIGVSSLDTNSSEDSYSYIYASDTDRALTFRIHWVDSDDKQAVYCTQRSRHFNTDGDYSSATWYSNSVFSEMAYAMYHGCSAYGEKADSTYTTGNWIKDYYATQTVLWCIREDYGYDGVSFSDLSEISGYEDVYDCAAALYKATKKNAGSDGYGDTVSLSIEEPDSTEMYLNSSGSYYRTGWFSLNTSGTLSTSKVTLSGAPDGAEIIYKDSDDPESSFYIRIPVEDAYDLTSDSVSFQVKVSGTFLRPIAYNFYSDDDDDQNITYLQLLIDDDSLSDSASVSLSLDKTGVEVYKTDTQTGNGVSGAVYGVYSDADCTEQVAQLGPTDENGYASAEFVMRQTTYYVKERSASEAYLINTEVNEVTVVAGEISTVQSAEEMVSGRITVKKLNSETSDVSTLGAAVLKGAVYGLYAAEEIEHPDGVTGIVYEKDALVASLTMNDTCQITFSDLYLGNYYVKEISAPVGYTLDETEYAVSLTYADEETEVIVQSFTVYEQVIRGDFAFTKLKELTGESLANVAFMVTSETTGESHVVVTDENGSVNTAASSHAHTENTNANDAAVSMDEDGNYLVDESLLDSSAGVWFGLTEDGDTVEVDDSLGALPYDTYTITELPSSVNSDLILVSIQVTISQDSLTVNLGDIDNESIPAITTSVSDSETTCHYSCADGDVTLIDTVSYIGLTIGETYTVSGILMNPDTGTALQDAEGNFVTAETTFTTETKTGTVEVEYRFNASELGGKTTVIFETLYDSEGTWVASHEDLNDEDQTVYFPEIKTTAADAETGTANSYADEEVTIIDTVTYRNVIAGETYMVSGILMDKETGEAALDADGQIITAEVEFTAESALDSGSAGNGSDSESGADDTVTVSGSVEVSFTFDASGLGGKTYVVFESLYFGDSVIAIHEDLDDEGQSISLTSPPEESENVKTEDTGNSVFWILLAAVCAAFAVGSGVLIRERRKKHNLRKH